jgi:hypothetical protein
MNFYAFDDIKSAGSCVEIAELLYGAKIANGRCAASWRNGDNPLAVAINKESFYDHVEKNGGGIVQLAAFKFGGDIQQSQDFLGEHYHLTPKNFTRKAIDHGTRYAELIAAGYAETRRDVYHNANGTPAFFEVRLDHPEPGTYKKRYLLGHGDRWGLPDEIERVLFNLPAVMASEWVCITEGPKKSCCLIERGVPPPGSSGFDQIYPPTGPDVGES